MTRLAPAHMDLLLQSLWVPDDVRDIDGWIVRRSRGVTKRANSVLPHGNPANVAMAVQLAEQLYRAHGLPPVFMTTPSSLPADLDDVLAARGYERVDEVRVLVADPAVVLDRLGERDRPVHAAGSPDGAYQRLAYAGPIEAAVMTDIGGRTPSVYASMRHDGTCWSVGRGALADGWLGLSELHTHEYARRRGLASDVIGELVTRGSAGGARGVVLQVLAANEQAGALYDRLGFVEHSRYHYRVLQGAPVVADAGERPAMVPLGGPAPT